MRTERPPDALADDLLRLSRLVYRHTNPVRRGELTPEQYWLLRELGHSGPLNVRQLAGCLGLTSSSVTIACKRLERIGLLIRQRQVADERIVLVALTLRGKQQLRRWRQRRHDEAALLLSPLRVEERQQLQGLLARVLQVADAAASAEQEEDGHAIND
jgi:DNA-binding MarR family transcriptional regulator